MSDKAVLMYPSDKEILEGERDHSDFDNYSNRISQIGSRVRTRTSVIVEELKLLQDSELNDRADEFFEAIVENFETVGSGDLSRRLDRLSRDLHDVEQRCDEIPEIRDEIAEIREKLEPSGNG